MADHRRETRVRRRWRAQSPLSSRERDSLHADLDALRLERAQLARALADARQHQAATRQANEAVAERLDDAIGSLRVILGV